MSTNNNKRITLSFDNGPHPEITDKVLDILARRGVKTTFFVIGKNLQAARAPAERAVAEGHWLGNHTWSHSYPFREKGDSEFVQEEIERAQQQLGTLAHPSRLFRPYGRAGRLDAVFNTTAVEHLSAGAYTCILWNTVPGDWKRQEDWPSVALEQISTMDWPLMVLHDIHPVAMQQLDRFIGNLQDLGYSFDQDFPADCIAMKKGVKTSVMQQGVLAN